MSETRPRRMRATGAGIAVPAASREFRPYHRFGDKSWNPGKDIPPRTEKPRNTWRPPGISSRPGDAAERRAEFARLRQEEGLSVVEAGTRIGLTPATAAKYETRRKREAGGAA
jgi:hypothetical protein